MSPTDKKNGKNGKSGRRGEVGPNDLRRAPPVKRLVGQLKILRQDIADRGETFVAWADSLPEASESNALIKRGSKQFDGVLEAMEPLFATLGKMVESGFSPPRKCFTSATKAGDKVSILEQYQSTYSDIIPKSEMSYLNVVKKYPGKSSGGKGGGLTVETSSGRLLKVAASHVVRLTSC